MLRTSVDSLARAQDLIHDAWEITDADKQVALARRALAISPHCADAFVVLAGRAERGSKDELELWQRGHEVGREWLGAAGFERWVGEFWGRLETRPYLRARFGLARALWERGHKWPAIDHLQGILRLNPNDNQGVRYVLAAVLVEVGWDHDLEGLLAQYREDASSKWSWTKALAEFRRIGDKKASRELLAAAIADNPYIAAFLLNLRSMPDRLPSDFVRGSEEEAICYAFDFRFGWTNTSGALAWLGKRAPSLKP